VQLKNAPDTPLTMEQAKKEAVIDALCHCDGHKTRAAAVLGISIRGLRDYLTKYNLQAWKGHFNTWRATKA